MKKLLIITALLSSFGLAAFAADTPKTEEVLVTISQANVCYKASVIESRNNGQVIQAISGQVPCNDKPAVVLPVVKIDKTGEMCNYVVGKYPNFRRLHQFNNAHNFSLVTRCPTDQK